MWSRGRRPVQVEYENLSGISGNPGLPLPCVKAGIPLVRFSQASPNGQLARVCP